MSPVVLSNLLGCPTQRFHYDIPCSTSVQSDDQVNQTPIPLVLVDKVLSLREDLITITALLGTYVLLYEETSFNPPIIQIVDVLLVLESLSQNIRPKEDQVDWVTEVQIRYGEVLQNPTAGLLCSVEAIKNEELPAGFVSWLDEQNPIHEAWQQIANDANIDAQKLYQNPTMDIKELVKRLDGIELLLRFTRYAVDRLGRSACY
ncbi:hypothetical protein BSL78_13966 [Apostichopus japonicus]|uniref:Uncharacterized protein n=1 Tax=Stichopus japonicus TaxID=307972 RepID=A0A2G8KMK1_STIJA|nr:hypothetical protein BSL78_13966 [Apostichopus japonicus]